MISLVYAQDRSGVIGNDNRLPWHLPNDLKFFKQVTMGHPMIMGRKTFESMNQRLLPGRKTIVFTSEKSYGQDIKGLELVHSLEDILDYAKNKSVRVIGGAQVFNLVWDHADQIIRTVIDHDFIGDTYVKAIDQSEWSLVRVEQGIVDDRSPYSHRYEWWERKE